MCVMMVMDVANQSKRVTVGHVMDVTRVENCQVGTINNINQDKM